MKKVISLTALFLLLMNFNLQAETVEKLVKQAERLLEKKEYEKAVSIWKKTLRFEPNNVDNLLRLGTTFSMMEKYKKAETTFKQALKIDSQNPMTYYSLGFMFLRKGDEDKALQYFRKTLEIDNRFPQANYQIGAIYEGRGEKGKAMKFYTREVNVNDFPLAWQRLYALNQKKDGGISRQTAVLIFVILITASGIILLAKKRIRSES